MTDRSDADAIEARIAALDELVASLAPPNSSGPADLREVPRRAHVIATRVATFPLRKIRNKVAYNAAWAEAVSTSLIDRLDRVEETVRSMIESSHSPRRDMAAAIRSSLPHPEWEQVRTPLSAEVGAKLLSLLAPIIGPVVHADAGNGDLLRLLAAAGVPAIGADPFAPADSGIDRISAVGALWALTPGSAGAIVLSDVTDYSSTSTRDLLCALAARALQPSGLLVIVANANSAATSEVSEFAAGHPFSPAAWRVFAGHHGFEPLEPTTYDDSTSIIQFRPRWGPLG